MVNTLDVTISGFPSHWLQIAGIWDTYTPADFGIKDCDTFWQQYSKSYIEHKTINLVNIETLKALKLPILKVKAKEKDLTWWQKFLAWRPIDLYDVDIQVVGTMEATRISFRSGATMYVDESIDCIKNALDACVWTADFTNMPANGND